jgi:arylesterase/paraoxonase
MVKKILLGSLAIIVIICVAGGLFLYSAVNKDVNEQFAGTCTDVPLPGSGEDTQIDRERQFAYVSVFDRLAAAQGEKAGPGSITRLDLSQTPPVTDNAILDGPALHPHGLSLHITASGDRHLYVINHPEDRASGLEVIEHYAEASPGQFRHAESFSSPLITRANDMVAVGPREFYVAQDVDRASGDTLTQLVYFDGSEYRSVADDIQSGGGINVSADGNTLYIAETGGNTVRIVSRAADGGVATRQAIDIGSAPDNIDVAADGSLWIGAHSNVVALAMHFIMGTNAPTQILRVDATSAEPQIEEIYMNSGTQISSGSGGATLGNKLLIGSITARKLLLCEMD